MNSKGSIFLLGLFLIFSCGEKEQPAGNVGRVTITGIELQDATKPNGRSNATFQWEHVFTDQLQLTFTKSGGESFNLTLNPNELSQSNTIELPFGTYEYSGISTAQDVSETLPITASGQIIVDEAAEVISIQASSDFGLLTISKSVLSKAPEIIEPQLGTYFSTSDFYFAYAKNGTTLKSIISLENGNSFRLVESAKSFIHQHFQFLDASVSSPDSFQFVDFALSVRRFNLSGNGYPEVLFPYSIHDLGSNMDETSGLQLIQGRLFSINDGGNSAEIQEINPASGELIRTIKVSGLPNVDWEDLAASSTHLFIGDFGNNLGNRTDLKILKIPIPALLTQNEVTAEEIRFSYSDQSDFSGANPNHNFDCEAMIFWENKLHLFSKNRGDQQTKRYSLSTTAGTQVAVLEQSFDSKGLITGADISPDGKNVVLLGYEDRGVNSRSFIWTFSSVSASVFSGVGNQFFLGSPAGLGQTEGIVIDSKMELTVSGERISFSGLTVPPKVFKVDLAGIFTP
ncbi:hypothetical protein [Algoriphagus litoralis]|uniref:hypothetical protein n=1 Tax=Algoriphagus litoralis TaxID=2202829 RepID=UPI00130054B3|nr:hypothetical protein [Algoriphagus litoralis]